MTGTTSDIWKQRHQIDKERRAKMKELIENCEKEGHSGGKYHDNGFGWSWFYCGKCGGQYDIRGPER